MSSYKYYYDLHMHSALSPCADNDMTPNNIVNMSLLKALDIIAVTDHNSAENAAVIAERAARKQIIFIPGMEIETAEEVHVVSLFPDVESALSVQEQIYDNLPDVKNKTEIFGNQYLMDKDDNVTDEKEQLLIVASRLPIEDVFKIVGEAGGIAIPAHVDRDSYSVISNLGAVPEDLNINIIEISSGCDAEAFLKEHPELKKYVILRSSDAHYLWDMSERENYIESDKPIASAGDFIELLRSYEH